MSKEQAAKFKNDPDLLRQFLVHNANEAITALSLEEFCEVFLKVHNVKVQNIERFYNEFVKQASKKVEANINNTFKELDLKKRFDEINKLESEYADTKDIAWRPTTGTVPINSIRCLSLKKKEKHLITEINDCKEKINSLKQTINENRKRLTQQIEDIDDLENKSLN